MKSRKATGGLGLVAAIAVGLSVGAPLASADTARTADSADDTTPAAELPDDFNGDGYSDVAVAAPEATVGGEAKAGYVAVMYGSPDGLETSSKQVLDQDKPGMPGVAEAGDAFGASVTSADLDHDGYSDLVVGSPGEDTTSGTDAGSLAVVWGGAHGLSGATTLLGGGEAYDRIGQHAVAGDFDGDHAPDVATVAQGWNLRTLSGPFDRDGTPSGGVHDAPHGDSSDRILDLAAGDLNGDGITDIAAAANMSDEWDARHVFHWEGGAQGLSSPARVDQPDGRPLQGGENLDVGDVDGDGYADIVVGRTQEGGDSDVDLPQAKGGMITYLPGGANGPDVARAQVLNQASSNVPGDAEYGDRFGSGISVRDINGDGYADVALGVPGEDIGSTTDTGSVVNMIGGQDGLVSSRVEVYSQDTAGVPGSSEAGDAFGSATKLADANGDGTADLIVGAKGENGDAGSVWAFRSDSAGVVVSSSFSFGAGTLGTVPTKAKLGSVFNF